MRIPITLVVVGLLAFACDASDISDNDPINPGAIDASSIDADPAAPDANDIDADPAAPDAGDRAQVFCDRYETLCGYDMQNNNRFDDEPACLAAFAGFDGAQMTCVEAELDMFELDANQQHCSRATGSGPCN